MHSRTQYPLFRSHIDLAHTYWKKLLKKGDHVIDATCGNGHDSLILAELALSPTEGSLIAIDLQKEAIESTKQHLIKCLPNPLYEKISFVNKSHAAFPSDIPLNSIKLIVYNLGYLPGGDKSKTTLTETTLKSFSSAQTLLEDGGVICMTCYSGHSEGAVEEEELIKYISSLDPREWNCCHHRWINRLNAPSLILIQKSLPLSLSHNPVTSN